MGHYEVIALLGAGGMGEVYRARDTKLGRDVALKVLPARFANDAERMARFQREAQVLASLNHPNIAVIHGLEESPGVRALVMELVEGPTLAERIGQGPIPLDESLPIARQIAEALDYAHEKGIVHRDLKPANIKVTPEDKVKVLDFGLAKAFMAETSVEDLANSPTVSIAGTREGVILGTAAYMSPEQARGKTLDKRTDIWAFGCVLYEMLAGRQAFSGETVSDVMAGILKQDPDWPALPETTPASIRVLLRRCLQKDARLRLRDAGDARIEIQEAMISPGMIAPAAPLPAAAMALRAARPGRWVPAALSAALLMALAVSWWFLQRSDFFWKNPLANAHFIRFTDFEGVKLNTAISADGKFVAFLSDRDGPLDAWVSQVGTGEFVNISKGLFPHLLHDDVPSVGFSGDGAHVWLRVFTSDPTGKVIRGGVWLAPTTGGIPRLFLENGVSVAWSPDGSKIVYHEPTAGDPVFVADANGRNARQIFTEQPGRHCHYPVWSPDGRFIYFVRGIPATDETDIWRIPVTGGEPERITLHAARVTYPTLLDARTLLYTATEKDGSGPWLYSMDVERRVAHRVSFGLERYIAIAASADGRRLAGAVANPTGNLWTVPITGGMSEESAVSRVSLPNVRAVSPVHGPDYLLYLSSKGGGDSLWKFKDGSAGELWKASEGALAAAPAISPDGRQICFSFFAQGRAGLHLMTDQGTTARSLASSLDVRGVPAWSPDAKWIAVAADEGKGPRLFKIPLDGGAPVRITDELALNPAWSPDGRWIVYSRFFEGGQARLKAVTPENVTLSLPDMTVLTGGHRYGFIPGRNEMVVMMGAARSQNFWLLDLPTGRLRQLTNLKPGSLIKSLDISPDGKQIIFDRLRENSDIVLIER